MDTTRPMLRGSFGMVTSTHWLASAAGMSMLERGGNAFDAAVAAGLVLQVAQPHLNGPAGEVPVMGYEATSDRVVVVAGQGPAPAAASIDRFAALGVEEVPGTGLAPACVPAAWAAWMRTLRDFGTMRLRDVVEPAQHYARVGVPVTPQIHATICGVQDVFRRLWPTSADAYLSGGSVPPVGSMMRNVAYADTLARLIDEGEAAGPGRTAQIDGAVDAFYRGFVAERISEFAAAPRPDSTGRRLPGLLTADDLAAWHVSVESSVHVDYGDYTVHKPGPWSQGPVFLQQLRLLEGFDLGDMAADGADFIHTVVECAKLAFADREAHYGDPDLVDVPLEALLSVGYARDRRRLVTDLACAELQPGQVGGRAARLPAGIGIVGDAAHAAGTGEPTVWLTDETGGDTCHLDVVDRRGNLVSATPSGGWLQSSPIIPELGFALGTRLQMCWLEPGLPSSLVPGGCPRTTLSPTIAFRHGRAHMAFGTPGGDQQDQWSLVAFLHHVHHDMDLQQAVEAPLFDTRHPPSSFVPRERAPLAVVIESRVPAATLAELRRRGHETNVVGPWTLGRVTAAATDDGVLTAAASPRGSQAYAVGR